jgi:hypothetical protein
MSNNEESDENPDQRPYQKELAHKTAFFVLFSGESETLRAGTSGYKQDRGDERMAKEYFGRRCALINRLHRRVVVE